MVALPQFVSDCARGMKFADALGPVSKKWKPGIGPHDERDVVRLVMDELKATWPDRYDRYVLEAAYPESSQSCDLCIGEPPAFEWAMEFRPFRMRGDNGQLPTGRDDVSKLLSPFAVQRSALTDCTKLAQSRLGEHKAIVIYAYEWDDLSSVEVIETFEFAASKRVQLGGRTQASFSGLMHPVHQHGTVYGWELVGLPS
jgi:hypothetical protein